MTHSLLTNLQEIGLADLRIIGRMVGVPSPTTLSRKDLLAYIIALAEGTARPNESTTKGKPAKKTSVSAETQAIVDEIKRQNRLHLAYEINPDRVTRALQSTVNNYVEYDVDRFVEGYLFRTANGAYLVDDDYRWLASVTDDSISRYSLADGALVGMQITQGVGNIVHIDFVDPTIYARGIPWSDREHSHKIVVSQIADCLPVAEGGITGIRGSGANTVLSQILDESAFGQVWFLHFGGAHAFSVDYDKRCLRCHIRPEGDQEYVRYICARVSRLAETGERIMVVAMPVRGCECSEYLSELADLVGCAANDGSISLCLVDGNDAQCDTLISTEEMGLLYPPVDLVRSYSVLAEEMQYAPYFKMKTAIKDQSREEAWHTWFDRK